MTCERGSTPIKSIGEILAEKQALGPLSPAEEEQLKLLIEGSRQQIKKSGASERGEYDLVEAAKIQVLLARKTSPKKDSNT